MKKLAICLLLFHIFGLNVSFSILTKTTELREKQCSCVRYEQGSRPGLDRYCYFNGPDGMACLPFKNDFCEDFQSKKTFVCKYKNAALELNVEGRALESSESDKSDCGCSYYVDNAKEGQDNYCLQRFGLSILCYPYSYSCPIKNEKPTMPCKEITKSPVSNIEDCHCTVFLDGANEDGTKYCLQKYGTNNFCYPGKDVCNEQNGLPTVSCKATKRPTSITLSPTSPSSTICNCNIYLEGATAEDNSSYCYQYYGSSMICYPFKDSKCGVFNSLPSEKCIPKQLPTTKPTHTTPTYYPTQTTKPPTPKESNGEELPPAVGFVLYLVLLFLCLISYFIYRYFKNKRIETEAPVNSLDENKVGDANNEGKNFNRNPSFNELSLNENGSDIKQDKKSGKWWARVLPAFMLKPHITAKDDFNRWLIPPIAITSHLCIGSVYAFSMLNEPLSRCLGVVVASPNDWDLTQIVPTFSISIFFLGMSAAVAGKFLEEVGPRTIGTASALLWGGSWILGGLFLPAHSLGLLYFQGVIGGCGLGLGYVSPVSTMLRWFEDRRGLAAGMAIVGFGGGAMVAAPTFSALIESFFVAPTYLGTTDEVDVYTEDGKRLCLLESGVIVEVVVATAKDILKLGFSDEKTMNLKPGVYIVGTGSTGVNETFFVIGSIYMVVMLVCAFSYRIPRPGWKPQSLQQSEIEMNNKNNEASKENDPENTIKNNADNLDAIQVESTVQNDQDFEKIYESIKEKNMFSLTPTRHHIDIDEALRTPQFYQLWMNLFLNITSGIGVIAIAKTLMSDVFASSMPDLVDSSFCAGYVAAISLANLLGRIGWASVSDYFGRKPTFALFFGLGAILYSSIPLITNWASTSPGATPLGFFIFSTLACFSFYGGGFSTIPAFIADVFGTMHVGGIHGRLLTAWSCAGVVGPLTVTTLRESSTNYEIMALAKLVDPVAFEELYGAPISELQSLIQTNIVTLANLLQLAPAGYKDPTPNIYSSTFFVMGCLLAVAFINNLSIKPVYPSHWMSQEQMSRTKIVDDLDHA